MRRTDQDPFTQETLSPNQAQALTQQSPEHSQGHLRKCIGKGSGASQPWLEMNEVPLQWNRWKQSSAASSSGEHADFKLLTAAAAQIVSHPSSSTPAAFFRGPTSEACKSVAIGTTSYEIQNPMPPSPPSLSNSRSPLPGSKYGYAIPPPRSTSISTLQQDFSESKPYHFPSAPSHWPWAHTPPSPSHSDQTTLFHMSQTNGSQLSVASTPTLRDEAFEVGVSVPSSILVQYGLHTPHGKKTYKFWILILAFCITVILTALDMTMISTALPSIVKDLPYSNVAGGWITSSYLLTMTAFQPAFGGLSCVVGRRWSLVLAILLFIGGSIVCALSSSILLLAIGRGIQGVGGGGIQAVGEISVSDITSLRERGFFVGIFGLVFAIASFIAPVLGGVFSDKDWRWIFWINVPIGAAALLMVIPAMNLPVPSMPLKTKFARMDMIGNLVLLGSVVGILIGVTEGGVTHPWSSPQIWVPFLAGMIGFFLFLAIEFIPNPLSTQPVLPLRLFSNRTASSAFFQTFLHGVATYGAIYALPLYFQAIKDQKPLKSAISTFPSTAPTAPFAIIAGIIMAVTGKYRNLTFSGWALAAGGFGWMTRFHVDTQNWELYTAQVVAGMGIGILFAITLPPIQASLPVEELETATATYAFCRSFGSIWGIAITTSVLTSTVSTKLKNLPEAAQYGLMGPTVLGYVETIKLLPEPLRSEARSYYADGLQKAMWAFLPLTLIGFFAVFFLQDLPLPDFIRDGSQESKEKEAAFKAGERKLEKCAVDVVHEVQDPDATLTSSSHGECSRKACDPTYSPPLTPIRSNTWNSPTMTLAEDVVGTWDGDFTASPHPEKYHTFRVHQPRQPILSTKSSQATFV